MIKNIFNLTKINFIDLFQNNNLFNKEKNKINIKSTLFWALIIVSFCMIFLSNKILEVLISNNNSGSFLYIVFLITEIFIVFQIILSSTNILVFSNNTEKILYLPFNEKELLISKIIVLICNTFLLEFIYLFIPLIIYGIKIGFGFIYYFYVLIVFLIYPILFVLIISIINLLLIKILKKIKNKNLIQFIIMNIFIIFIFILEFIILNNNKINIENLNLKILFYYNNKFIDILNNSNINSFIELIKIIILNLFLLFISLFIGKKIYIKELISNYNEEKIKKINKKINLEKMCKKRKIKNSIILKDLKIILNKFNLFIQCLFPIISAILFLFIIVILKANDIREFLFTEIIEEFNFTFYSSCLILMFIQIIFIFSNLSLTAFSREGKNINYIKYIPVDFYKQIIYKSKLQFYINNIICIIILFLINYIFYEINFINYLFIFLINLIINYIYSILMVIVDLKYIDVESTNEDVSSKLNKNKIYQYGSTILLVLFLNYLSKVLENVNIYICYLITILVFIIILIIQNLIIKKYKNKLFIKIK